MGVKLSKFIIAFVLSSQFCGIAFAADQPSQTTGRLVLIVTLGDIDNTPANHVIIQVYGEGSDHVWGHAISMQRSKDGQYEATLGPGKYDVFLSQSGSVPRCRRVAIRPGLSTYWTVKLEIDDIYTHGEVF